MGRGMSHGFMVVFNFLAALLTVGFLSTAIVGIYLIISKKLIKSALWIDFGEYERDEDELRMFVDMIAESAGK
ncbi:unnamed protein product [Hydatigera taeniaeformis]|uniref:Exported protein n=1 Tax=Hydatigena taeniaeformis TaxID=6205 RepID=A0A0R3WVW1_HYDTA|nr:unnamed protein product [Hydatigera taeniaeformis]